MTTRELRCEWRIDSPPPNTTPVRPSPEVSGLRRPARVPLYARISGRRYLRWIAKEIQSHRFGSFGHKTIFHPPALIIGHEHIFIGDDVVIHPGAFFSVIAEHQGATYQPRLTIGEGTRIGSDMVIACCGSIDIGRNVLTADRVYIGDTYHQYRDVSRPVIGQGLGDPRPVRIEDGAFLGINSVILPGVTVGEGACIGASAVVTADVPPRALAVGNPARVVRRWDGEAWVDEAEQR